MLVLLCRDIGCDCVHRVNGLSGIDVQRVNVCVCASANCMYVALSTCNFKPNHWYIDATVISRYRIIHPAETLNVVSNVRSLVIT